MRETVAALLVLVVLGGGCDGWPGGGTEVVTTGDGLYDVDGTDSTPTSPVTEQEAEVPGPGWHLRTYDSDLGTCVDLEEPGGRREVRCEAGSGLDLPVEHSGWLGGPMWRSGAGWVHVGLAREEITHVGIVVHGQTIRELPTHATVGSPLRAYLIWAPLEVERYELTGADAAGCIVHREPVDISPAEDEVPPGSFAVDC